MKTKFNIKPVYIAALVIIIFGAIFTKIIVNSNNNNRVALAAIIEQNNLATQTKLDGLQDGVSTLNENDKIIAGKIDALSTDLGLLKEDVALLQEDITSLGLKVEDNQKALLIEMQGIKSTVDNIKKQGYNNVTAQKVISYNRCVAASSAVSTCAAILD
jgi:peptidoglycan hydrolase CwlO-like protein